MKELKRIFFGIGFFLLSYYAIYFFLFSYIYNKKPLVQYIQEKIVLHKDVFGKSIAEFDRSITYDFIFVGSSHCYRCFDPEFFLKKGFNCYNLGSSSQTPLNSFVLIKEFYKNAKGIIVEVYPFVSSLSGEESFYSMNASVRDYRMLASMAMEINDLRCYNIFSLKPFFDSFNADKPYNILTSSKGYVETKDSVKHLSSETLVMDTKKVEYQLQYFSKIISFCKQNDLKLFFVYAPVPSILKIEGEGYFINALNDLAENENISFLNFGRNHQLDDYFHFFDNDHLNKAGVLEFNTVLIDQLSKN